MAGLRSSVCAVVTRCSLTDLLDVADVACGLWPVRRDGSAVSWRLLSVLDVLSSKFVSRWKSVGNQTLSGATQIGVGPAAS